MQETKTRSQRVEPSTTKSTRHPRILPVINFKKGKQKSKHKANNQIGGKTEHKQSKADITTIENREEQSNGQV